jgi:hypothetical protein
MSLRLIPTRAHGIIDYLTSGTLLTAPELLRLKDVPSATLTLRLTGAKAAAYSLLTDYELGLVRLLPMRVHLALDAASGAFLASTPWLFGFAKNGTRYWLPHTLVGVGEILAAVTSKTTPGDKVGSS